MFKWIGKGDMKDMALVMLITALAVGISVLLERVLHEFLIY